MMMMMMMQYDDESLLFILRRLPNMIHDVYDPVISTWARITDVDHPSIASTIVVSVEAGLVGYNHT